MDIDAIRAEIRSRAWDWSEMPDDETEGLLSTLADGIRPYVPLMWWDGHQGEAAEAIHLVVASHPGVHMDIHHDSTFWQNLDQPAVYMLFAQISGQSRVFTRYWNIWPKQRLEFMLMSDEEKRHLPANWPQKYGPYAVHEAPTDECRRYERVVDDVFVANGLLYLSPEVLKRSAGELDQLRRGRTLYEVLFGFYP